MITGSRNTNNHPTKNELREKCRNYLIEIIEKDNENIYSAQMTLANIEKYSYLQLKILHPNLHIAIMQLRGYKFEKGVWIK